MDFFRSVKQQLHNESPLQIKQELIWLWGHIKRYGMLILAVGTLGLVGTGMGLASSVASKYLIDAVTGFGTDIIGRAAGIMAGMMLGSLVLQALSSRVRDRRGFCIEAMKSAFLTRGPRNILGKYARRSSTSRKEDLALIRPLLQSTT